MNTKNNQRSRETDERIIRVVFQSMEQDKKPLNKITVRQVCERANINRSTFYAHYQDVYDVVEKAEKEVAEELTLSFLTKLEAGASADACFESLFAFIYAHQDFYRLYLNEMHQVGGIGVAWDLMQDRLSALSPQAAGARSTEELAYHGDFYLYGMTAMIRRWINRGCPETPRQMVGVLKRMFDPKKSSLIEW